MNILLNGICGYMGKEVAALCREGYRGARLVGGVDPSGEGEDIYTSFADVPKNLPIDCIVDFSTHSATAALLEFAKDRGLPVVIATTGHNPIEKDNITEASEVIPVFFSSNMSLGIAILIDLVKQAVAAIPEADIEIVEKHHTRKVDSPSGTALMIAEAIIEERPDAYANVGRAGLGIREKEEIGIHSVRMGNVVGEHEVLICTPNQTITLKHEAHNRALFAEGGLCAAEFIIGKSAGLYDMKSLIAGKKESFANSL